ncbi:MAG: CoA transferase [Burkholderiaceae bacterium]|jgi:crotonobetainyl-CoA:carnitine CoA-transferase CaiB-like acyl-CoA transferase|uniref:CoA transferase n=1 Tax=Cupriavidus metallidurans TaxID=119219 RepID=A0A482IVQ7_9BURK|nr:MULTISPECIES: CaiB/BaiF CoA-transferase family protein [Cupriavidus]KWR81724.1 CoA-transferase [Cupriavidus sp. SHE]PCH58161.1 MAG: CoA transferase [Burkholderiaceae bacterium]QBP13048.1 CoA transferase [Cupriavidus metallidurans]QWC90835.1 CoA transferase [Cupriavidus metallidurans]
MLHRALEGIRVLDLSRILAGPWCTQNLADLGAEVVKVEHPQRGDDTRGWGPPYLDAADGSDARLSAYFISCNRGKQSVCIDYGQPEGVAQLLELARHADVLVENYKVGTLKRYGLDYASLKAINPRLIYLSITGFGQDGPMADKPGYDYVFQGMGGLMSYTGQPDGSPGAGPLRTGVAVVDVSTGMYATSAVLAALFQRQQTGEGQHLDIALLDVAVALNANQGANYLVSGKNPQRSGNAHPNCAPYEVFRCADGYLILAIGNDAQFARFCDVAGRPDLAQDPRYVTNSGRIEHLTELRKVLTALFPTRSRADWTAAFDAAGVPWGPIHTMEEVFAHPQVQHRQLRQVATHPVMGEVPMVRNPMLPANPQPLKPPPLLGEHTGATAVAAIAAAR